MGQNSDEAIERLRDELKQCRTRVNELEHRATSYDGETRVLKMVAQGAPLPEILGALCQLTEALSSESLCEISLFDPTGSLLEHRAAPHFPRGYIDAIHRRTVTLEAGPGGLAARLKKPVVVVDIASDARWDAGEWRSLALAHSLRACESQPIFAADGTVIGACGIYWKEPRNPTEGHQRSVGQLMQIASLAIERDRKDESLRASEARFRLIFDAVPGIICTLSASGEVELLNRHVLEYFGKKPEELKNWTMIDVVHPDDLARVVEEWKHSVETGEPFESEQRQRRADGVFRWHLSRALPSRDVEGRIIGWHMLITDVDDRKKAEEALQRSEAYLKEAQRLSHTGSFGWKLKTGELIWSAETFRILGYGQVPRPVLEMALDRVHPDDRERVRSTLDHATRDLSDLDFQHRLLMPDGAVKHLRVVARATGPCSEDQEYIGVVMDITEHTRAQDAVRSAKARFEGILDIADDAIVSVDSEQRIMLFNQGAENVFGYAAKEVIGQTLDLLLPERFAHLHRHHVDEFSRSEDVVRSMGRRRELFGRRKDGTEFPAEASISKLQLGRELVFTVILRDITERQRLENHLRRSEQLLAEGQRLTKTGSWVLDFKTGNTDWSVETCRIFGFADPPPSPHYSEFRARVRPEDRDAVDRGLRESFETGESRPLEYVFILPNGTPKHIETISQPVRDATGAVVRLMGTIMDVTERKRAEANLRAAELLARGQLDALTHTLDALAQESDPDRLLEHVLRTILEQAGAHSVSAWARDEGGAWVDLVGLIEDGRFQTRKDAHHPAARLPILAPQYHVWSEMFQTRQHAVFEDIDQQCARARIGLDANSPWQRVMDDSDSEPALLLLKKHLQRLRVCSILFVPMVVAGHVAGIIGVRFQEKRAYRHEDIELTRALGHQAMLAIQLTRLSAQSRRSAVIAERNRMARDIHDTLAQGFTGVIVQLEAAADATTKGLTSEANEHLGRAGNLARESLNEARRSVRALRPQALEEGNLCGALDDLIRKMTAGTTLQARFSRHGMSPPLSPEWEENLLRIGQEVLTNALRHSHASEFAAQLAFEPNQVRLELRDNGCGFNPFARQDGLGLLGIRERVEGMGGQLSIESAVNKGTVISIRLPLEESSQPSQL